MTTTTVLCSSCKHDVMAHGPNGCSQYTSVVLNLRPGESHPPLGACHCARSDTALKRESDLIAAELQANKEERARPFAETAERRAVFDFRDGWLQVSVLRAGLELIAGSHCTTFTRPQWACLEPHSGRYADALFGAGSCCDQCIAHATLEGIHLPMLAEVGDDSIERR